jgi:hypothetical protein
MLGARLRTGWTKREQLETTVETMDAYRPRDEVGRFD